MFNESVYAVGGVATNNTTSVPIDQLLLGALAIWSAFFPLPMPAVTFVPAYKRLPFPQIGHIECDDLVTRCTILVSEQYGRPDIVMLHEVGHAYLFRVYPIADSLFNDDHWVQPNSLMSSHIGHTPTILRRTVELMAGGAPTHLCTPSCPCRPFRPYGLAPKVCGEARRTQPYFMLPLLAALLAGVTLAGIGCCLLDHRPVSSSPA